MCSQCLDRALSGVALNAHATREEKEECRSAGLGAVPETCGRFASVFADAPPVRRTQ